VTVEHTNKTKQNIKNETKNMKKHAKLILSALALAGFQAYGQNLVQNGNFATGTLADWHSTGGNMVESSFAGYLPPPGDSYFLAFGAVHGDSSLQQTINTMAGKSYEFSFLVAGNGTGISDVNAYWGGHLVLTIANPIPNQPYTEYKVTEIATGPTTSINFGLRNDPSYDALDNIRVTVPDSGSSLSLMATALTGLFGFGHKLRRRLVA
jgi:hypothetical protein